MHSCQKEDDDRSQDFRAAQKEVAEKICIKEVKMNGKKWKQATMDELMQPRTKSMDYSLTSSCKSGSHELDSKIASFFYENTIPFNVADSGMVLCVQGQDWNLQKVHGPMLQTCHQTP